MGDEIKSIFPPAVILKVSDISTFLKTEFHGKDIQINAVKSIDDICENALVFSRGKVREDLLKKVEQACIITSELPDPIGLNTFIIVQNPRLAFAKVLSEFFVEKNLPGIGRYSVIHPTAKKIGRATRRERV